ncbi:methylenetetrahydrofolate reductase [NAD(P)H] [Celeribacter sp.]|uniref:methylenetetrahydrofolate reductase [NAD(P)H] n=1 Tax=Celeribacter sp. TaxID=1890673 RepID=UPI003A9004A2
MATAPNISFEFFPPKNMGAAFGLFETVNALHSTHPSFVSVTYGAGGTTRTLTHEAVELLHKKFDLNVAAHLTCVDATRAETLEIANAYADAGVTEIVALRGDPPKDKGQFEPHEDGFANSVELIEALAETGRFTLRVGAYPDPHPEAADENADVLWLKRKFEAGADSAITQFFFEPDTFFRFRDRAASEGITGKIIPGILPIVSLGGLKRFAATCGMTVPTHIEEAFDAAGNDSEALSIDLSTKLCERLIEGGVEDLHFYTLNRPGLSKAVLANLGIAGA